MKVPLRGAVNPVNLKPRDNFGDDIMNKIKWLLHALLLVALLFLGLKITPKKHKTPDPKEALQTIIQLLK